MFCPSDPPSQIHTDWPSYLRNKGIFFVKRDRHPIPEIDKDDSENGRDLLDHLTCGDIYPNVLGQIISPVISNSLVDVRYFQTISVAGWRRSSFRYSRMSRTSLNSLSVSAMVNISDEVKTL